MEIYNKISKNVVNIGDSMINNIKSHGLPKSKKVNILNIPGPTTGDIVNKTSHVLEVKPESLIVNVVTNDLNRSKY